jgi:sulfur-oxidizing protein SoxY
MLFEMVGGFSISENPSFRFSYIDNGADYMTVRAVDTEGTEFTETFALRSGT